MLFLNGCLKINMTKLNILYEGKAKILYETNVSNELIQFFKDDATAHNAQKLEIINSKGIINNYISEFIMNFLEFLQFPVLFLLALPQFLFLRLYQAF